MKQNPIDESVRENLRAGILARDGFLGGDGRPHPQIIQEDAETLSALGTTPEALAVRMEALTKMGLAAVGSAVKADGYTIQVDEYMGKIGCPFRDHRAPKRNTSVTDAEGKSLTWTDLSIHLIRAHGFFQGRGSAYRLEPAELAKLLRVH